MTNNNTQEKLLPCSHCGGGAELTEYELPSNSMVCPYEFCIYCKNCHVYAKNSNKHSLIRVWNTRHPQVDNKELIEALRKCAESTMLSSALTYREFENKPLSVRERKIEREIRQEYRDRAEKAWILLGQTKPEPLSIITEDEALTRHTPPHPEAKELVERIKKALETFKRSSVDNDPYNDEGRLANKALTALERIESIIKGE